MTINTAAAKKTALLWLAAGRTTSVAAEAAGVRPSTVSSWRRNPVFAEELAAVKAVYEQRPQDADALMRRLEEAEQRFARKPGGITVEGSSARVHISVPAGATPRERERLVARGMARGIARVLRERGEAGL
ncbi:hypothetical protein [Streptomyces sp. NPDC058108]|uniref:hypothetical protein n=1 Tax=Streptomyces sp. NPDC058108 TaxID=3346344 RepID=UPI0036EEB7C7